MTVVKTFVCDRCKIRTGIAPRAIGSNWEILSLRNRGTIIDLCDECFASFQSFLETDTES